MYSCIEHAQANETGLSRHPLPGSKMHRIMDMIRTDYVQQY